MTAMKTLYFIFGISYLSHVTKGCMSTLDPVYAESGGTATFLFTSVPIGASITDVYEVAKPGEAPKIRVSYIAGIPGVPQTNSGITFIGKANDGNLSFTLSGIVSSDKGQYILTNIYDDHLQCITLHILGTPIVVLTKDGDPIEGGSVTLTCSATSTTEPAVSVPAFTYSWIFDSVTDPSGARYSKSVNTFTISSVTQADSGKVVTCTATEDVAGGLTSVPSNGVNFTVTDLVFV